MQARSRTGVAMVAGVLVAAPLAAQQVRVRSLTTARYVELAPVRLDSTGDFAAAPRQGAAPLTQDVELSAWGLGMTGLRAYGQFRFRGALGSDLLWPRSADHFDALHAFLELERPSWRLRAGRQQRVSGLGVYAFDGGSAQWRVRSSLRLEAFAGRGLARGFLEPLSSDAVRAIDPFRPNQGTLLFGVTAWAAPAPAWSVSAAWQREMLDDRSGLVSERVAFDARSTLGERLAMTASLDGDLAAGAVGRARLAASWRWDRGFVDVEAFRYRPVFDLTTIWGVFSPEGHYGVGANAEVALGRGVRVTGDVTHRRYRPTTDVTPFLGGVGDQTTTLALGARWSGEVLSADAQWRLLTGYGGAESGGDLRVGYARPDGAWRAGVRLSAFQEEAQFRVADGTVVGLGADARARVSSRLLVRAEGSRYWHRPSAGDVALDWSQLRALLAVEWTFGASADRVGSYR